MIHFDSHLKYYANSFTAFLRHSIWRYMISWVGWTKYESTYPYGDPRALSRIGDQGRGYGMYGFDYRYGLVPMMQFCVNHSNYYNGLQTYIDYGVGDSRLVNNTDLHNLFISYANDNTADFLWCQNQCYINDYLNNVLSLAQSAGVANLDNPYIIGTLGSMAIRNGWQGTLTGNAIQAMAQLTNVTAQLQAGYAVFDNYYDPLGDDRWHRQLAECLSDMAQQEELVEIGGNPPKGKNTFWNFWFTYLMGI